MSQEKYYDYFVAPTELSNTLKEKYDSEISEKRNEIKRQLLAETGAIAWTERKPWGSVNATICELVFPSEHEIVKASYVCKPRFDFLDGEKVVIVRGKNNRKDGVKMNAAMKDYTQMLSEAPAFGAWTVNMFDCNKAAQGGLHSSGRGTALLTTEAGTLGKNGLVCIRIPNKEGEVVTPDGFDKVTYGTWFDLINETE